MQVTGIISLLIIISTCIISYQGFKSTNFFARYELEVEKILLYRDYKRLLTSVFLHVNWQHLIFNMLALFFFSFGLESTLGPWRLALLYFGSALGGNLLALLIHKSNPGFSSVGASGAINGVIFASIVLYPGMAIFFMPGWLFGLIYILYSIYGIRSQKDNIGHEAHLGGAIIGVVAAVVFYPAALSENMFTVLLLLLPTIVFMIIVIKKPQLLLVDNLWFKNQYNYTVDDRYNIQKINTQQEVDRILDKISKKGLNSLSRKEREVLEDYSRK
ncbi:MAG: rhomboid family intramembrane serine protease [Bacteroidetes bacterium]|nr:rhomboid family intramembrane serine protease [Bacteroidota bacterium]